MGGGKKMKAAVYYGIGDLRVEETDGLCTQWPDSCRCGDRRHGLSNRSGADRVHAYSPLQSTWGYYHHCFIAP